MKSIYTVLTRDNMIEQSGTVIKVGARYAYVKLNLTSKKSRFNLLLESILKKYNLLLIEEDIRTCNYIYAKPRDTVIVGLPRYGFFNLFFTRKNNDAIILRTT